MSAGRPERGLFVIASRIFAPEPAAASFRLERAAASLAKIGPTRVLTTAYADEPHRGSRVGAEVRRMPALRDRAGYVRGYVQYLSFDIPLFFRLLAQPRGTVVLCEPPPTTGLVTRVACAIRGFKYAYYAADLWSEALITAGTPAFVRAAVRWMERRAIRGATTVLAVSKAVADRLPEFGARQIMIVGNGIDTHLFCPAEPTEITLIDVRGQGGPGANAVAEPVEASGVDPSTSSGIFPGTSAEPVEASDREQPYPLLVYAGTASEVHGAAIFINAMKLIVQRHPDARLVFIGQGTEIELMREAAKSLPADSVQFLPRKRPQVVADWLNRADIALASVRPGHYGFAFPTKAYAAAACGTPVVYTGSGPSDHIIRDNKLGQAADYDAVAIADAVDAQLADTSWDAAAAVAWVETHGSLSAVADRVAKAMLAIKRGSDEENA